MVWEVEARLKITLIVWLVGWLVGWLMESLRSYAGGGIHDCIKAVPRSRNDAAS
jgi:hypothetical protein